VSVGDTSLFGEFNSFGGESFSSSNDPSKILVGNINSFFNVFSVFSGGITISFVGVG
jgi:hypothetical protein